MKTAATSYAQTVGISVQNDWLKRGELAEPFDSRAQKQRRLALGTGQRPVGVRRIPAPEQSFQEGSTDAVWRLQRPRDQQPPKLRVDHQWNRGRLPVDQPKQVKSVVHNNQFRSDESLHQVLKHRISLIDYPLPIR